MQHYVTDLFAEVDILARLRELRTAGNATLGAKRCIAARAKGSRTPLAQNKGGGTFGRLCRKGGKEMRIGRARWIAVMVTLVALVGGLAASVDAQDTYPWYIVPGGGVGPITIGMRDADVTSLLGPPTASCVFTARGATLTTLYYAGRGLVVSKAATDGPSAVVAISIVRASQELADRLEATGSITCSAHGMIVIGAAAMPYVTRDGIELGTPAQQVLAAMGVPEQIYPAVPDKDPSSMTTDETRNLLAHNLYFIPPPAQVYWYDGVVFGVADSRVVSIGILRKKSAAPRPGG